LATVFRVGCFGPFFFPNQLLLLCDSDGFAERSVNFGCIRSNVHKKHATEPMQSGKERAQLNSFSNCFGLVYCLKSFRGTMR
jgi:hypothetical protein